MSRFGSRLVIGVGVVVVSLAACGASDREIVLERRVNELEAQLTKAPPPSPALADARVQTLQQRVDELESLLRELRQLEVQTQASVAQLAEHQANRPSRPPRPSLDDSVAYPVPIDDSPQLGSKTAAVTLVAAVQFPEPFTHRSWPVLEELRRQYGKDLRVVIKTFTVHKEAHDSSIVGCAVAYQGGAAIAAFEDALWSARSAGSASGVWPDGAQARDLARSLKLDNAALDRDISGRCDAASSRDQDMFTVLGQSAVPVFWINGRPLSGAQPIEKFRARIDEELTDAHADRRAGGNPATYYDRLTGRAQLERHP